MSGRLTAIVFLFLGLCGTSHGATLVISGGQLVGATGVTIPGLGISDVSFMEGTCVDLFGGCDANSDFSFSSEVDAQTAAQALLDQVFIGLYDDDSTLTEGCDFTSCAARIPWKLSSIGNAVAVSAVNKNLGQGSDAVGSSAHLSPNWDSGGTTASVWAVFTPPTAVPLPAAAWLFLSALGSLAVAGRSRRVAIQ